MKSFGKYMLYAFISLSLVLGLSYMSIKAKVETINIENKKSQISSKTEFIKTDIENGKLIEFKNYFNLNKIYYVKNSIIESSSSLMELGKKTELRGIPEEAAKDFAVKGYWFLDENKLEYYSPVKDQGILVLELNHKIEKIKAKTVVIFLMKISFIYILLMVLLMFLYFIYNFYQPMYKVMDYLKKFKTPLNMQYYSKKPVAKNRGDFSIFIGVFNDFLDLLRKKINLLDGDRRAMKQIYEKMKLKNSQVMSLYEFAKTLSFDVELEKIYEKINDIMISFMSANVLVLVLKDERGSLELEYLNGVSYYENKDNVNSLESVIERVKKPIKILDAEEDKRVNFINMTAEDKEKLQEFIMVPLKFEDTILGYLIVDQIFSGKLKSAEEIATLTTIGELIGRAIKKALKYREMNIGLNMTSLLYKITTLVETKKNLYDIFKEILSSMKKIIDYSSAAIYLLNDKNELEETPEYREGERNELLENVEFKLGKGIKALVAQNKDTVIIRDLKQRVDGLKEIFKEENSSISSFASVPMLADNKIIGVINLTHKEVNKFKEEDKKILKLFANQAASTIQKIKKDKKIEELLAKVTNDSITDPLTKLYNRRYMMKRMEEELARAKRERTSLSIMGLDIDFFKKVNDNYGHQSGDRVLEAISALVKETLRVIDVPCRYGGEEFFVILPNTKIDGALIIAERIRRAIEAMVIDTKTGQLRVTTSIGLSTFPNNATEVESLIKCADEALYTAKETGRNRVIKYGK